MGSKSCVTPGERYHYWEVLEPNVEIRLYVRNYGYSSKIAYSLCRCRCGTERKVNNYALKQGVSKSCGCRISEYGANKAFKYTYNDKVYTLQELSYLSDISYPTLYRRLVTIGMDVKDAVEQPLSRRGRSAQTTDN